MTLIDHEYVILRTQTPTTTGTTFAHPVPGTAIHQALPLPVLPVRGIPADLYTTRVDNVPVVGVATAMTMHGPYLVATCALLPSAVAALTTGQYCLAPDMEVITTVAMPDPDTIIRTVDTWKLLALRLTTTSETQIVYPDADGAPVAAGWAAGYGHDHHQ